MQPLLRIQTIPIKIEAQTKRASLQYDPELPSVNVSRQRGGMNIRTTPAQVSIDQQAARNNSGLRSTPTLSRDFAQAGIAAAQESTRTTAQEGNQIVDSRGKGNPIIDIAAAHASRPVSSGAPPFGQTVRPDISATSGSVSFDYQMDSLTFDWHINTRPQLEYIPGSIEYSVTQYPDVIIEYVGEPIYVPASSNPNYVESK